jgi:short-subunit dehydrogenase
MELNLKGKSVLITGASKGIGLVIAEALAAEGCNLHIAARNEGQLKEAAERLTKQHGVKVTVHRRDLGEKAEVESLGKACEDVDILVNNAGDIPPGTIEEIDGETWRKAWDVKVYGYVDLTRIIYRRMCARKSGVIINIVGAAARMPNHRYIAGCMANIALNMFT